MRQKQTTRHCVSPEALSALRRDGMGWGHDLDCGCFRVAASPPAPGLLARALNRLKGGL